MSTIKNVVKKSFCYIGIMLVLIGNSISYADELVDGYIMTDALPSYRAPPKYPISQLKLGNEGMVALIFMINNDGSTSEVSVLWSSNSAFEKTAINAVKKYKYKPVFNNYEPIIDYEKIVIIFAVENSINNATPRFVKHYNAAATLLNNDLAIPRSEIEILISKMEKSKNHRPYSLGSLSYIKFQFANKYEGFFEQLASAEDVDIFIRNGDNNFISKKQQNIVKKTLLNLYIKNNQLVEALIMIKSLQKNELSNNDNLEKIKSEINTIHQNDQTLVSKIKIHKRGYSSLYLFKDNFSFNNIDGQINTIKLRCKNKFTELTYMSESEYKIPKSWGKCHIQILGDKETTAQLVQH